METRLGELDAAIATKVMGWKSMRIGNTLYWTSDNCERANALTWSPTTNPSDDYRVLEHVRETWTGKRLKCFAFELCMMREARVDSSGELGGENCRDVYSMTGDYARAALAALEVK